MKLNEPIEIDFYKFLKDGTFDYIKIGQSKEWIINNFPDPDGYSSVAYKYNIWTYGNLEFHFDGSERLYLIYSDYLRTLDGGNNLKLNKWIFDNVDELTLIHVLSELNNAGIDYIKKTWQNIVFLRLSSNVELTFEDYSCGISDTNLLKISSISLSDKDFKHDFWSYT